MPRSTEKPNGDGPSNGGAAGLRRNQACYQCRKRKVKCDALRPVCTTCLQSARRATGLLGSAPNECTYDEPIEVVEELKSETDRLKSEIEQLKARNGELEAMFLGVVETQDQSQRPTVPASSLNATTGSQFARGPGIQPPENETSLSNILLAFPSSASVPPQLSQSSAAFSGGLTANLEPYFNPPLQAVPPLPLSVPQSGNNLAVAHPAESRYEPDPFLELLYPGWPSRLPAPDLLTHLIDVFFTSHPNALHIIHRPTFMYRLAFSPTSREFPHVSILHAICAVGSLYSLRFPPPPRPEFVRVRTQGPHGKPIRTKGQSFGEMQAELSNRAREQASIAYERLLELAQSHVILNWWYNAHADWIEHFDGSSRSLRNTVAMELNVSSQFGALTIHSGVSAHAMVVKPGEEETAINLFWLAYLGERQMGITSTYPSSLDDEDISQFLPVKYDNFESQRTQEGPRQRILNPNTFTTHPPATTDTFTLYLKSFVILSRVKSWCNRARSRYPTTRDLRETPEFQSLDILITDFAMSFPKEYRDPFQRGSHRRALDIHLFVAHCVSHAAYIALHMPLVNLHNNNDISAQKCIMAARAMLELVYSLTSTSFDFSMLDPVCAYLWTAAGRVFSGYLKKQIAIGNIDEAKTAVAQLEVLQLALNRMGERLPIGTRQATMLNDLINTPVDISHPWDTCSKSASGASVPSHLEAEGPLTGWETMLLNMGGVEDTLARLSDT